MFSRKNRIQSAPLVKVFFAIATSTEGYHRACEDRLQEEFGPLGSRSALYEFSKFSQYYDVEMTGPVWKYLVSLAEPCPADQIIPIKLSVEKIQEEFAVEREGAVCRTVNIDPGYVNGWQVVLSTVKNYGHRLYMGQGIFCEVTLLFRKRRFEALPWTFSDYSSALVLDYLTELRGEFRDQISGG
ncbi:MAG: DUF4416 family protein [Acidobacteriota bacterium]|nr:MAG: DUF4416 family protein [Acidobacteriota bacterium]